MSVTKGLRVGTVGAMMAVVLLFTGPFPAMGQTTRYVDIDATGATHDGSTWCNAYTTLQDALAVAVSGNTILVADGTYKPDQGGGQTPGDRDATFLLISGVILRGGYAGCGAPNPDLRDIVANETILSGDLMDNDTGTPTSRSDNSKRIVRTLSTDPSDDTNVLDGLTVLAADGTGGVYVSGARPTFIDCTFSENTAQGAFGQGAGVDIEAGEPTFIYCTFTGNRANDGAGLNIDHDASAVLIGCSFNENMADDAGGGIAIARTTNGGVTTSGSAIVINSTFTGNSALVRGGGIHNNGSLTLTNCTFSGNSSDDWGGGLLTRSGTSTVTNCTFSKNDPQAIYAYDHAVVRATNSILWGNAAQVARLPTSAVTVNYSIVQGGWSGAGGVGILDTNPRFVHPDGADGVPGTDDDNLRLRLGSPAIDAADNNAVPPDVGDVDGDAQVAEPTPLDLDGNPRFVDDPFTPDTGDPGTVGLPIVDMGAYEFRVISCQDSADCDDGDACSGTEICMNSFCAPAKPLDDGTPCDDGQPCTADVCTGGVCEGSLASPATAVLPNAGSGSATRHLAIHAGDAGRSQAIRVTFTDLEPPYDIWNGVHMWVQAPQTRCEHAGTASPPCPGGGTQFQSATLGCTPHYMDWSTVGTVYVHHEGVVPRSSYTIEVIDAACAANGPGNYSTALPIDTSKLGDCCGNAGSNPPNGTADLPDVIAVLQKFANSPGAPIKARLDHAAVGSVENVDHLIGLPDVLAPLHGFANLPYSGTPSVPDPCP